MKTIIYTLIPIIILLIIQNKGFLPVIITTALSAVIFAIGFYFLITELSSMWMRDSNNYQEFDWDFNPETAPGATTN
jgi:Kef-type K+ transport system membrane component KefB